MVTEFHGDIDENFLFFIIACELIVEIARVTNHMDIMFRTILTRTRGQTYEVIKFVETTTWGMLKT